MYPTHVRRQGHKDNHKTEDPEQNKLSETKKRHFNCLAVTNIAFHTVEVMAMKALRKLRDATGMAAGEKNNGEVAAADAAWTWSGR